jgi:hypothetical protein
LYSPQALSARRDIPFAPPPALGDALTGVNSLSTLGSQKQINDLLNPVRAALGPSFASISSAGIPGADNMTEDEIRAVLRQAIKKIRV